MTLSKANAAIAQSATLALEQDRTNQRIMTKWLKGYSITDISVSEGGISHNEVRRGIVLKREEYAEAQKGEIDHIVAERIAGLKIIQKEAFDYIELFPEKVAQLLTVALRSEETQAKIQGVLNEKVLHLGRIEHTVKMYDFTDNTPNAVIIDAVMPRKDLTLREEVLPTIEEVIPIDEAKMGIINNRDNISDSETVVVKKPRAQKLPNIINSVLIMRPGDEIFDE